MEIGPTRERRMSRPAAAPTDARTRAEHRSYRVVADGEKSRSALRMPRATMHMPGCLPQRGVADDRYVPRRSSCRDETRSCRIDERPGDEPAGKNGEPLSPGAAHDSARKWGH